MFTTLSQVSFHQHLSPFYLLSPSPTPPSLWQPPYCCLSQGAFSFFLCLTPSSPIIVFSFKFMFFPLNYPLLFYGKFSNSFFSLMLQAFPKSLVMLSYSYLELGKNIILGLSEHSRSLLIDRLYLRLSVRSLWASGSRIIKQSGLNSMEHL